MELMNHCVSVAHRVKLGGISEHSEFPTHTSEAIERLTFIVCGETPTHSFLKHNSLCVKEQNTHYTLGMPQKFATHGILGILFALFEGKITSLL